MEGMPQGIPGLPPLDSQISNEDRIAFVKESLDEAERILAELNDEQKAKVQTYLSDAEETYGRVLADDLTALRSKLEDAENKLAKVQRQHSKKVGEYIQAAYDTIRLAGHNPIVDYTTIQEMQSAGDHRTQILSALRGANGNRRDEGSSGMQLVQSADQSVLSHGSSFGNETAGGDFKSQQERTRELILEKWASKFGKPGDIRYEIARWGTPSPRYPDDNWRPPVGTRVYNNRSESDGPGRLVYVSSVGGFIEAQYTPEGNIEELSELSGASAIYDTETGGLCPEGTVKTTLTDGTTACVTVVPPTPPPPPPPIIVDEPNESPPPPPPPLFGGCTLPPSFYPPGHECNPAPECPPGTQLAYYESTNTYACVPLPPPPPPQCPAGTVWSAEQSKCVPFTPPPPPPPPPPGECYSKIVSYLPSGCTFIREDVDGTVYVECDSSIADIGSVGGMAHGVFGYVGDAPPYRKIFWIKCEPLPPPPPPPPPPFSTDKCYRIVECGPFGTPVPPPPPPPPPPTETEPPEPPSPGRKHTFPPGGNGCESYTEYGKWLDGAADALTDVSWGQYFRSKFVLPEEMDNIFGRTLLSFAQLIPAIQGGIAGGFAEIFGSGNASTYGNAYTVLANANLLGKLSGVDMTPLTEPYMQIIRSINPVYLPPQAQTDVLYLFDYISDGDWSHATSAMGNLVDMHRCVRDSQQARIAISELIDLFMRNAITRDELDSQLRKRGVLDSVNTDAWLRLRQALPTETDLIPFMVRDVENPNIDWTKSDEWFAQNYAGDVKDWGKQLGINDRVMMYRARAHWQLPSNTALYEMMARNRPGRVPKELEVSNEDARKLLQQNDMEPSWIDKVLSISYLPPTRTDIKMGIKNRTITDKHQATELLLDARISPAFAETLTDILWDDAQRQIANETNLWSRAKVTKFYKEGLIDRAKADELLARFVPSAEMREQQLNDADDQVGMDVRRECTKAIKNRVLRAEITELEASQQLEALGIPSDRAGQLAQSYVCYRASRGTELTIRYLKKVFQQGLLSPEELYIRFRNLRYTEEDASLLVRSWGLELQESQRKEAERELKQRESEIRSARSRYRTEVAWYQKQIDRLKKQTGDKSPGPVDAVDTNRTYIPPNPTPPIP